MNRSLCFVLTVALCASGATRADDFTETFSCKGKRCENVGQWTFDNFSEGIFKETGKGKPRFYFGMSGMEFIPFLHSGEGAISPFTGNYRERMVQKISFRTRIPRNPIPCGIEGRKMSLALISEGPEPGAVDDCAVYAVALDEQGNERDIPSPGDGFVLYEWDIDSQSPVLPAEFVTQFDRCPQFDLDGNGEVDPELVDDAWNLIVEDVDQVMFCYERCDFFSIQCQWNVHADDITIDEVP